MSLVKVFSFVRRGDLQGLETFLSSSTDGPIDLNQVKRSDNGRTELTPLMLACDHRNLAMIDLLIKKGARVDFELNSGSTALIQAVRNGKVDLVDYLINYGAQLDLEGYGMSVLQIGCQVGSVEIVKALMSAGAQYSPSKELSNRSVAMEDRLGLRYSYSKEQSPMNIGINNGHIGIVKMFLDKGDVIPAGALFSVISSSDIHMVQILLDYNCAQIEPNSGLSALMLASYLGNSEVVKILLEKGAEVNYQNAEKEFALMLAARVGEAELVKQLLEGGANVNLRGKAESTVLMSVLSPHGYLAPRLRGDKPHYKRPLFSDKHKSKSRLLPSVVEALLADESIEVNHQDDDGRYALLYAVDNIHYGRVDMYNVFKLLLDKGADPALRADNRDSVVECSDNGFQSLLEKYKKEKESLKRQRSEDASDIDEEHQPKKSCESNDKTDDSSGTRSGPEQDQGNDKTDDSSGTRSGPEQDQGNDKTDDNSGARSGPEQDQDSEPKLNPGVNTDEDDDVMITDVTSSAENSESGADETDEENSIATSSYSRSQESESILTKKVLLQLLAKKEEKDAKKFSIIVYGVDECPEGTSRHEQLSRDINVTTSILTKLDDSITALSIKDTHRLGKYHHERPRPRPILVKFLRSADVSKVLELAKRSLIQPPYSVKPYLSKEEQRCESALLKERWSLIQSGTSRESIKIRLKDGVIMVDSKLHGKWDSTKNTLIKQ